MKYFLLICTVLLLSLAGYGQSCTLSVKVSQSAGTICSGNSVTLAATSSGGTAPFTYVWSTGETSAAINVNKAGTYTVTVSDKTPGCQPVKQSVTIGTSTTPDAPTAKGTTVCVNSRATLTATAPGGNYQWYDAAVGGKFLHSGDTYTTDPINAATVFYVETTIGSCTSARTPVFVNLSGKPNVTGASVCAGSSATLTASGGDSYTWYDAPAGGNIVGNNPTFATPILATSRTYYVVVVSSAGCTSARTAVTAKVTPPPPPPTSSNMVVCAGTSANLHADAPTGIFNWYTVPNGGTPLISSPDYTTPPLFNTTTYYVETSIEDCVSTRTKVTVTVTPTLPAPAAQNQTTCYNSSAALSGSANPADKFQFYNAPTGGTLLFTGHTYNTPVLTASATYYMQAVNGACTSARSAFDVIVKAPVSSPSVSGAIICPGSVATLTATGPGGNYQWYNAAVGGKLLASSDSFTTPPLVANTTYYVQTTLSGCVSPRSAVTVSVLPVISPPTASGTTACSGNVTTLSASGSAGGYAWYDAKTNGNLLSSAQVFVTPALASTTTYYVEATSGNCSSARVPVKVTVNPDPAPPTASGKGICAGTSASLTASAPSGTFQWYDAPTSGKLLANTATFNTPALIATTTYYVQNTSGQCVSTRTAVTVTINNIPDPQFQYPSGTFCATGPNPSPAINNPSGGTFSSTAGLVFVSTSTGQINIGASTPGKYTISFFGKDACPHTSTVTISIVNTVNSSFSYGGPYCQDGVNPLPTFPGGASAGSFSCASPDLVFLNPSSGEIDLSKSKPGTYTITNTINASGGCPASISTSSVTIEERAVVNAGPDQTVPIGTPVQLAGSVSGGATTGTWTGGTGSFSNAAILNPVYSPGAGEVSATLTLKSNDPPGVCGPKTDKVVIIFKNQPTAPTAAGTNVCSGSVATLSATAPGGTYQWYDAAVGGNLLQTGPSFVTPMLIATTTYYVQTSNGLLTSNRTSVTVTVNTIPAAPVASGTQVCNGSPATLSASGSAGSYEWYDAAVGGNLLSKTNTYNTPALTANVSYYVQAIVNNCTSARTQVDVTVTPIPNVTSSPADLVCSGNALNYTITADVATATFNWSRAQVAGISNAAVNNQAGSAITETLINTTTAAINVTYLITPVVGTCSGPVFKYTVTVYPTPSVTSKPKLTICNSAPVDYTLTFNAPGVDFSWSRAAIAGISNAEVTGQKAVTIKEVLFNTTDAPIDVVYIFNYRTNTCDGPPFSLVVTVNPEALVTSDVSGVACSKIPQAYVIKSNIPSTTFTWSRDAVNNISNPAVANQKSGVIDEALNNINFTPVSVIYNITPSANGCDGTPFKYTVIVNPFVEKPVANANSPVCVGSAIHLRTTPVTGATYQWTGPNGYSSADQNPDITKVTQANAGTYTLVVTVRGCPSEASTADVVINDPPLTDAGPGQTVCITNPSIFLKGTVTGGTSTGIWTTAGSGTFKPSSDDLNAEYLPSDADRAAGAVVLTLTSTSKDDCKISASNTTIKFGPLPAIQAGPDQEVCAQTNSVQLDGKLLIASGVKWTTSGTGTFTSDNSENANYLPSADDIKSGSVKLTIRAVNAGPCDIPTDDMTIKFIPPPTVNAGGTRYVLRNHTITLHPTVSDENVKYQWSPNVDINDVTVKEPVITGDVDRTYTLTITDSRGCVAQDTAQVKVSPELTVQNTFTPNGDGINDTWNITGLVAYEQATVDIFTRYGQKIFHSLGYPKAWDGTYGGKQMPTGVYYFVIDTHINNQVLSGYVTIIR